MLVSMGVAVRPIDPPSLKKGLFTYRMIVGGDRYRNE